MRLACQPWVTAVAVNSFALRRNREDPGDWPVDAEHVSDIDEHWCDNPQPAIWIWPSRSQAIPLRGGESCSDRRDLLSAREMDGLWKARNHCQSEPLVLSDESFGKVCRAWECDEPFWSCVVKGGHPWPGTADDFARRDPSCIEPSPDFPTAKLVWEFFSRLEE